MSIYRVLDKLETYIKSGTVLPMKRRVLSEERLFELIEKLRSSLPEEVGQAKLIARDKERVLREVQERAVDEHELVQRARTTAETVLREAEARAAKIRTGADAYAAQVLTDLDARLSTALGSVKKGIETLAAARASAEQPVSPAQVQPLVDAAARAKRAAFDAQTELTASDTAELQKV